MSDHLKTITSLSEIVNYSTILEENPRLKKVVFFFDYTTKKLYCK